MVTARKRTLLRSSNMAALGSMPISTKVMDVTETTKNHTIINRQRHSIVALDLQTSASLYHVLYESLLLFQADPTRSKGMCTSLNVIDQQWGKIFHLLTESTSGVAATFECPEFPFSFQPDPLRLTWFRSFMECHCQYSRKAWKKKVKICFSRNAWKSVIPKIVLSEFKKPS